MINYINIKRLVLLSDEDVFTAFQQIYQHKWQYLQRVVSDMSDHFVLIDTTICTIFLPAILGETTPTTISPISMPLYTSL